MLTTVQTFRPGIGGLFPTEQQQFLVRRPSIAVRGQLSDQRADNLTDSRTTNQPVIPREDTLVRLPSLRESKWKVKVLQSWVGCVVSVKEDTLLAVIRDVTNSHNPPEEIEVELSEISTSDLPLMAVGAIFYWSIGYFDTEEGQRQRVSVIRFARQPRLGNGEVNRAFERADRLAALLESA